MTQQDLNKQAREDLRYYGEVRFKQLTLLMGFMGIVIFGIAKEGDHKFIGDTTLKVIAAFGIILFSCMLWVMEIRSTVIWTEIKKSLINELPSHNKQYMHWINATSAVLGFYILVYSFWGYCVYKWSSSLIVGISLIVVFAILTLFSVENYLVAYHNIWGKNSKKSSNDRN